MSRTMKKFPLLVLATAILACSESEDVTVGPQEKPVPIVLQAAVDAAAIVRPETRAAVEGVRLPPGKDIFRVMAFAGSEAPSAAWSTPYFGATPVDCDADGNPSFAAPRYYPADSSQKVYFYAWSPAENELEAGTASMPPVVRYTITGNEDIMIAQCVEGFDKTTMSGPAFRFGHKLMRVHFQLRKDASLTTSPTVNKIEILGMKTSARMNIRSGELTFDDAPTRDLAVYDDPRGITVTDMPTSVGICPMIEPATTLKVRITAGAVVYPEVHVTLQSGAASQNAAVTLTFRDSGTIPSASIVREPYLRSISRR